MLYEDYTGALFNICSVRGFQVKKIASVGPFGRYTTYKVIAGNLSSKKTVCIAAGIHGDELSGIFAIRDLLARLRPVDYRLVILPVCNPYGFDYGLRETARGKDLNRLFFDKDREALSILKAIQSENPDISLCLHEDDQEPGAYAYSYDRGRIPKLIGRTIGRRLPISDSARIYGRRASKGVIFGSIADGSMEDRLCFERIGMPMVIEVPDRIPFRSRVHSTSLLLGDVVKIASGYL